MSDDSKHSGCDSGTHEVAVALPTCGHQVANGSTRCPVCGMPPAVAIAIAYNEHPLEHARLQRLHVQGQIRDAEQQVRAQQVGRRRYV